MAQVRRGKDGKLVLIEDDVLAVARGLLDIDPKLRLRYSEEGHYFVVYWCNPAKGGKEDIVLTSQELTPAILERVRYIMSPAYDFLGEVDRMDAQAEKDEAHRFHEETGVIGEVLAHAVRKDLQSKSKAFVRKVPDGEG